MMKKQLEVVAGILWRNGHYLAVERPEGAHMAGWWEFPGGKIEEGESVEQALVRELHEELGVTASSYEFMMELEYEYDEYVVRLRFFHVTMFSGELCSLENQKMQWVDPSSCSTLKFLPADNPVVEVLHSVA